MENNELFKTIERLKESLSEVESARQQVSDTVAAYSGTQKEIGSFVNKLNDIKIALDGLVTLLENHNVVIDKQSVQAVTILNSSCDTIIANADAKLSAATKSFRSSSETSIAKITEQLKLLEETIEKTGTLKKEITALTTSVKALQEEFSSSQKAQNTATASIALAQKAMSSQLSTTDSSVNGIITTLIGQNNSLARLDKSVTDISSSIERLRNSWSNTLSQHTLLLNNTTAKHIELNNNVSALKTLLVIQLIISIIAFVILFVFK